VVPLFPGRGPDLQAGAAVGRAHRSGTSTS
jgi:hypothetical protein